MVGLCLPITVTNPSHARLDPELACLDIEASEANGLK